MLYYSTPLIKMHYFFHILAFFVRIVSMGKMRKSSLLWLFSDVCQNTAVYIYNMSVDEVGCIGSQEYSGSLADPQLCPHLAAGVFAMMNWSNGCLEPSGWISRSGAVCGVAI